MKEQKNWKQKGRASHIFTFSLSKDNREDILFYGFNISGWEKNDFNIFGWERKNIIKEEWLINPANK